MQLDDAGCAVRAPKVDTPRELPGNRTVTRNGWCRNRNRCLGWESVSLSRRKRARCATPERVEKRGAISGGNLGRASDPRRRGNLWREECPGRDRDHSPLTPPVCPAALPTLITRRQSRPPARPGARGIDHNWVSILHCAQLKHRYIPRQ